MDAARSTLLRQGYAVTGVDQAEELLALARARLPQGRWLQAAMETFQPDEEYDGAVIKADTESWQVWSDCVRGLTSTLMSRAMRLVMELPGESAKEAMNVAIHDEKPGDEVQIHQVTELAFSNVLHTEHSEQFIVDALRLAGVLTISKVARIKDRIVGHVAVSPVTVSGGAVGWFGIGPVSVLPEFQGGGIGSGLMQSALAALEKMGAAGCVVLGDPGYYGRFGFAVVDGLIFPGVPPEYFQALSFCGEFSQGEVLYHEAFFVGSNMAR